MSRVSRLSGVGILCVSAALMFMAGCSIPTTASTVNGTPQPSYIFQDSLKSDSNNWTKDDDCFFASDGYHIKDGFICFPPTDDIVDSVGTVTVKQLSGDTTISYGLVFRHPSSGNYYAFEIDSNGKWQFFKDVDNTVTTLADYQANDAIKSGLNVENTIQARVIGQNYTFFVNGTQVGQFADTTFTSAGSWGLDGADNVEVVYTDFSLAKP